MSVENSKNKSSSSKHVIALIGKTGNGKSATGNTLLDVDTFHVDHSSTSVTKIISQSSFEYLKSHWTVYDIPGLFDSDNNDDILENLTETYNSFLKLLQQVGSIGIGVFVFVFNVSNRFTKEEKQVLNYYRTTLGNDFMTNYGILVLTHGENYEESEKGKLHDWLILQTGGLKDLYLECQKRAVLICNKGKRKESRDLLLSEIIKLISRGRTCYNLDEFNKYEEQRLALQVHLQITKIKKEFKVKFKEIQQEHENERRKWFKSESNIRNLFLKITLLNQNLETFNHGNEEVKKMLLKLSDEERKAKGNFKSCVIL